MDTLDFQVQDGVGWIRLTRPQKRNPMDGELRQDLMTVLDRVRDDPDIRVLVLAGSPGAFCAGGNLNFLHEKMDAGPFFWQQRLQTGLRLINDLLRLTRPVIAVVDGPAFGAGFALTLTADIVLVGPQARFAMSYLKLGLVPDLGPMYLLPRVVGLQRAKELMLSAREVGPEEAKTLGIAMEVCTADGLEPRAREIARSLAQAAPAALAFTKQGLNLSLDADQQTMFALEASSQAAAFSAPQPHEAIQAMLARQGTPYKGF